MIRQLLFLALFCCSTTLWAQEALFLMPEEVGECLNYRLVNSAGGEIALPENVNLNLNCHTPSASLSPQSNLLVFEHTTQNRELSAYHFASESIVPLLVLPDDLQAPALLAWSPNGKSFATVLVAPRYQTGTRLLVVHIQEDLSLEKQRFDIAIKHSCNQDRGCLSVGGRYGDFGS